MATLASQAIKRTGLSPAYTPASAGGDLLTPGSGVMLHAKNTDASQTTITVVTPKDAAPDIGTEDLKVVVPAGEERLIGPLPKQLFADPADGMAHITYSSTTALSVAALELVQP